MNVYPTHRVVVARGISMCGQLVMEVDTLTPVLLMATHLAFILLQKFLVDWDSSLIYILY